MVCPSLGGDRWVVYVWEEKKENVLAFVPFSTGTLLLWIPHTFLDPTLDLVYGYVLWFIENHSKVGLQRRVKQLNQCAALLAACLPGYLPVEASPMLEDCPPQRIWGSLALPDGTVFATCVPVLQSNSLWLGASDCTLNQNASSVLQRHPSHWSVSLYIIQTYMCMLTIFKWIWLHIVLHLFT